MKKVLKLIEWPITEDAFPDPVFRAYVFDNFDVDRDGKISEEEALNVKTIDVSDRRIKSLTGLEYFPKLRELNCWDNQLTSLDVTNNPKLRKLDCGDNQLTSLDVTKNPELSVLICANNQLTRLDVSKNPELSYLACYSNQLTSLDVSKTDLGNSTKANPLNCSYMPSLRTLTLKRGWRIEGINVNRRPYYKLDTKILYVD